MEMTKIEDWLEGIPSKATRKSYLNGIKTFEKFYGKGVETLIGREDAGKIVEKFYSWMKQKGSKQNTARVKVNAVIQFLKFHDTPVKYRKALGMYRTEISTEDHMLQVSEVQAMAEVANLREQIILEVLLLGLRVQDACRLKWKDFDVGKQNPPIPIQIMTKKEGQVARTFISAEFEELLEKYLPTTDKKNKYLIQTARKGHPDEETLNWILKDLAERARINVRGKFSWHMGRKLVMRTCAELAINQWNAKMLVGKSVPKDILTYLNGVSLEGDFLRLHSILTLKRSTTGSDIDAKALAQVALEGLGELLEPIIQKKIIELQMQKAGGKSLGIIQKPDLSKLSAKEKVELFLKLRKEEKERWS